MTLIASRYQENLGSAQLNSDVKIKITPKNPLITKCEERMKLSSKLFLINSKGLPSLSRMTQVETRHEQQSFLTPKQFL